MIPLVFYGFKPYIHKGDPIFTTVQDQNIAIFETPQTSWWQGITGVYRDQSNRLWISNTGAGISMIELTSGKITYFDQTNGLPNDFVLNFMEDHEGNIWMGTRGGGLIEYSRNNFVTYSFENIINGDVVRAIFQDSKGNYWFGLSSAGIVRYDGTRFVAFSKDRYPGLVNVRHFLELDDRHLLILTFNGLYIYNGSDIYAANQKYGFENRYQFSDVLLDGDTLWMATQGNGVFRIGMIEWTSSAFLRETFPVIRSIACLKTIEDEFGFVQIMEYPCSIMEKSQPIRPIRVLITQ